MDGYQAARQIKSSTPDRKTIVIALTASVLDEERSSIFAAGCDDFLKKPFRDDTIFQTLKKHLGIEYIYSEETSVVEKKLGSLKASDLKVMLPEWLNRLHDAVKALDDDLILELIAEIPDQHSDLANHLTYLVEGFQIKRIRQLIEEVGTL